MKEIIIWCIIVIVISLFVGHVTINFKPFSIELPYWNRSLGLLLVTIGLILIQAMDPKKDVQKKVEVEKQESITNK